MNGPARIDVHHHIVPSFYRDYLEQAGVVAAGGRELPEWSADDSLAVMDRHGIATAVASISAPGVHLGDDAAARSMARRCNEFAATLVQRMPSRWGCFAVLPLPDVDGALEESAYALDVLRLDGVVLLANHGGRYLGDARFDALFEELDRRGAIVFLHPTNPPGLAASGLDLPAHLFEFPFDTTRAVANLVYSGTLERCAKLRIIVSHAGGTVPFLSWRLKLMQNDERWKQRVPKGVEHYLRSLYYDTALSASPPALAALQAFADPARIVFGSDYPFADEAITTATVRNLDRYASRTPQFPRAAVDRANALALFPRLAEGAGS